MSSVAFDPWAAVVASPQTTLGDYTIMAVTQDSDLNAYGELEDYVEYAYTLKDHDGIYTTRVALAVVQAGFGDFAIAEDVATLQALYAL